MEEAPLIGISRLRMGTDGQGVTTLVAFHGCPLHCKYCLNSQCNSPEGVWKTMAAQEIYERVKKDALYFRATNGGLTFGGGEPLIRSEIIKEILDLGASKWYTTIETSLNVPHDKLKILLPYINHYIVDIKDMDRHIYEKYTNHDNRNVLYNLNWLSKHGKCDDVTIRVPHIPGYNENSDVNKSIQRLREMGFSKFDVFKYHRFKRNPITNWIAEKQHPVNVTQLTGIVAR